MSCHILDVAMLKPYGQSMNDYIKDVKQYFDTNIKNIVFLYKDKPVHVLYHDDVDVDRAWKKFAIGSEKSHGNTTKVDRYRIEYIKLIPIILNNVYGCLNGCESFFEEQLKDGKCKLILNCKKFKYLIVLRYNKKEDCYYMLSAYVRR